jgi:predicted negative regulator of RcsB-dependent stress response
MLAFAFYWELELVNFSATPVSSQLFGRILLLFIFAIPLSAVTFGQAEPVKPASEATAPVVTPASDQPASPSPVSTVSAAEAMKALEAAQSRIERARALIAAHRLDIAAGELESVRATTKDNALRNITSIMLMNVYLEDGNYGRAEALLDEAFKARATTKDDSLGTFFALAGQAVNGARTHLTRYRSFGVSTSDAALPSEASADLNRLRSLLERMIAQAREISNGRQAYDSLSLLEDVLGLRLSLARDSEDQTKWQTEYAGARESLASSQTQIASLGGVPPLRPGKTAVKNTSSPSPYSTKKLADSSAVKAPDLDHAAGDSQSRPSDIVNSPKPDASDLEEAGSLNAFATKKIVPKYPPIAKQSGASGMVRVYVIVEGGKVVVVSRSEGPVLLRQAAEDAARQWTFQKVSIEGRPTRLSGYLDFNFTL